MVNFRRVEVSCELARIWDMNACDVEALADRGRRLIWLVEVQL